MTLDTALYRLNKNAFTIISDSYAEMADIASEAIDAEGSRKQPKLINQLIEVGALYDQIMNHVVLNAAGTAIVAVVGEDVSVINSLILCLKRAAGLNALSQFPTPLTTISVDSCCLAAFDVGAPGSLLVSNGLTWINLPMGDEGDVLVSTPAGLIWSSVVGNGIPSGGSTGQFLIKNSNTSYDVIWNTLTLAQVSDVTSSPAELNILDGVNTASVGFNEINTLIGINTGLTIQQQIDAISLSALPDGQFWVGNASNVATPVTPTGDVVFTNTGVFAIQPNVIVDADVSTTAAIVRSKLSVGNSYRVVTNNATGVMIDAAAIIPSRALVSDLNGIPTHSSVTTTALGFISTLTSNAQTQLNARLTVSLTAPAQGDTLYYNGTNWVNLPLGSSGQVLSSNGTTVVWGSATSNGLPVGGTAQQILRKIDGTNYNAEWHTQVLADNTDVVTTATELNLLSGLTVGSGVINYLSGASSNIQTQIDNRLSRSLAYNSLFVGDAGNLATQFPTGPDGYILTSVNGVPQWEPATPPGNVSGVAPSTDNAMVRWNGVAADSIQNSGVIVDDSDNITGVTSLSSGQISILNQATLRLYETGSTNYIGIRASSATAADYTITLPAAAPASNTFLQYDGANYVWATAGAIAFTDLTDVPSAYAPGTAGYAVVVNATEDGLEFVASGGGGTVTSVTGTTDRITSTGGTTPVINIAATYVGQASITTLGTITTGIWSADNIALGKGGTGTSLAAPAGDRILFYDLSAGSAAWLDIGAGISITGTTLTATGTYTNEDAQDAVGNIMTDTSTINFTYDDTTPSISAIVINNSIGNAQIRQSAALSVIGNITNGTANVADIAAASDFQVLRRSGTAIGFGSINLASSNAVTGILPAVNGGTGVSAFTTGSVIFAGASGELSQDNSSLFWNNTTKQLLITGSTVDPRIAITTNVNSSSTIQLDNTSSGTSATSLVVTRNNLGNNMGLYTTSSGYTPIGPIIASQGVLYATGAGGMLLRTTSGSISFATATTTVQMRVTPTGVGMKTNTPTATLHLAAGAAAAGGSPFKLTTGIPLLTPEDGAMEYHGSHIYFTIGSTRYQLDQQNTSSGTVTSVGLNASPAVFTVGSSPVTTSGVIQLGLTDQTSNTGFWGPVSGVSASPTFRAMVPSDLPYHVIEDVPGLTYNYASSDKFKIKRFTNASGCTVNLPNGLPTGWEAMAYRAVGAGVVTIIAEGTLEGTATTLAAAGASARLITRAVNINVALFYGGGSGSGISNSAAANEMMKSDGSNAVPSGVFSTTAGSLLLGSTALITSTRTITAVNDGATATAMVFQTSGASAGAGGSFTFTTNTTSSSGSIALVAQAIVFGGGVGNTSPILSSPTGISGSAAGKDFEITSGPGYSVGNNNGGNIILTAGAANGSGTPGSIRFNPGAGTINITNGSTTPSVTANQVKFYSKDVSSSAELFVMNELGVEVKISGNILINDISATSYTFLESDNYKIVRFTNASGCNATVPAGLSLGWQVLAVRGDGAGLLTFVSGGTWEAQGTSLATENTSASIIHRGSNVHIAFGAFASGGGGGGITNGAANLELMMSDGTNAVASTIFVPSVGNLDLGNASSTSGSNRTVSAKGTATDIGLIFANKGAGNITFTATGATLTFTSSFSVFSSGNTYLDSTSPILWLGSNTATLGQIKGKAGTAGKVAGTPVNIIAGDAYSVGNNNGGALTLQSGAKNGSGTDGNIILSSLTGSIIFTTALANDNALTEVVMRDPSTGILKYRTVASISGGGGGGITNGAANTELMKSDGTNAVSSKVFIPSNGNITLGDTSIAATFKTISADGTGTDVSIRLTPKGSGYVESASNIWSSTLIGFVDALGGAYNHSILISDGQIAAGKTTSTHSLSILGANGTASSVAGNSVQVIGGTGYSVGNNNGGDVILTSGAKNGSGNDGNITLNSLTGTITLTSSVGIISAGNTYLTGSNPTVWFGGTGSTVGYLKGSNGTVGSTAGITFELVGGNGYGTGNTNGGHVSITTGAKNGSGTDGNLFIQTRTGNITWFNGNTTPSATTDAIKLYVQDTTAGNADLYALNEAGVVHQLTGAWTTWTPVWTGFSADPTVSSARYRRIGKVCHAVLHITAGTSNTTAMTVTLPVAASIAQIFMVYISSGGVGSWGTMITSAASATATVYAGAISGAFSNTLGKGVWFSITYEV